MSEISRPMLLVYAAATIAVVVLGVRWLGAGGGAPGAAARRPSAPGTGERVHLSGDAAGPVVVHVAGAVRRPGVYRLHAGARVIDAVGRAGGATSRANEDGIDLAAKLADGVQVVVPARAAVASAAGGGPGGAGGAAGAGGGAGAAGGGAAPAGPLSLNSATAEQLDGLDGVGPTTAQKIVAYRAAHGGFGSIDELDRIPGIGAKKLAALRPQVTP